VENIHKLIEEQSMQRTKLTIEDVGQITRMSLPDGFVPGRPTENVVGDSSLHSHHWSDDPDVRICVYYRGYGINPRSAQYFRHTLDKSAHVLSPDEIYSLSDLFAEKANPALFTIAGARTEIINGMPVLVMEGVYGSLDECNCSVYIDADGTGKFVQEIFFQTPEDRYKSNFPKFREALASIEWK
jgi:hypothetical protein